MKIVVVGAGYGGVKAAQLLAKRMQSAGPAGRHEVTLVNQSPFHVIKTELHTIAGGSADDPGDVQVPLAELFRGLPVNLVFRRVEAVEPAQNRLLLEGGGMIGYDRLVLALGASPEYFGIPGLREHSLTLSDVESALAIRRRVDDLVRRVASKGAPEPARIVVGGGGLTGVELAGELAWSLKRRYARSGANKLVKVTVVEGAPALMPGLDPKLGEWAKLRLEQEGVQALTGFQIAEVSERAITLRPSAASSAAGAGGSGDAEALWRIEYDVFVWSGGVRGNRLLESVFETDRKGRVVVNADFKVEQYPNVRVLGDAACVAAKDGRPAPPTAQAALQQAAAVARSLWREIAGERPQAAAAYAGTSKGILASVGPEYGVGLLGAVPVRGRWVKWIKDANNVRYLASIGASLARTRQLASLERAAQTGFEL